MERTDVAVMRAYGRSGSNFIHGLFDQHEEVALLPLYVNVYDFYTSEYTSLTPETYLNIFERNNPSLFDLSQGNFSSGFAEDAEIKNVSRIDFCDIFFSLCQIYGDCGRKEYFLLLHIAFFLLRGRSLEKLRLIFVNLHMFVTLVYKTKEQQRGTLSDQELTKFFQDFPKAKFVATMRDPLCYAETTFGFLSEGEKPGKSLRSYIFSSVWVWSLFYDIWDPHRPIFLLKLPDLHRHFDQVMQTLCAFLDVRYDPSFQEGTIFDNATVNSSKKQGQVANTANPHFVDWKGGILSEYQISILRFFFREILERFFPENATRLHCVDYLRVGRFWLSAFLFPFETDSLRDFYYDTFQKIKRFPKSYCKIRKIRFLDMSRTKTYLS
jgi:hypothetical protein